MNPQRQCSSLSSGVGICVERFAVWLGIALVVVDRSRTYPVSRNPPRLFARRLAWTSRLEHYRSGSSEDTRAADSFASYRPALEDWLNGDHGRPPTVRGDADRSPRGGFSAQGVPCRGSMPSSPSFDGRPLRRTSSPTAHPRCAFFTMETSTGYRADNRARGMTFAVARIATKHGVCPTRRLLRYWRRGDVAMTLPFVWVTMDMVRSILR